MTDIVKAEPKFKVGDKVFLINRGGWSIEIPTVQTVTNISPAGNVKVTQSSKIYTSDGYQRGGDTWYRGYIDVYDENKNAEYVQKRRKQRNINYITGIRQWSKYDVETLDKVYELLKVNDAI